MVSVQPREALRMHEAALDFAIAWHGNDHPNVAVCYGNIGNVYEALVEHQKSLEIQLRVLGCEHEKVAADYNNIGNVYGMQGDHENALLRYFSSRKASKSRVGYSAATLRRWPSRTLISG